VGVRRDPCGGAPVASSETAIRRAVLAQRKAGHKTNEVTQVKPLLDAVDLRRAVVTCQGWHRRLHVAASAEHQIGKSKGDDND
jgi:hypothetical protein